MTSTPDGAREVTRVRDVHLVELPPTYAYMRVEDELAARPNPQGLPDDLRGALISLRRAMGNHARDWFRQSGDAWLAGIICGWDCPAWPHADDYHPVGVLCPADHTLREQAARHGWTADEVARLRSYRRAVAVALGEVAPVRARGFASKEEAAVFLADQSGHPRYHGDAGVLMLLQHPETVEHAYKAAQHANPGQGPEYLAELTDARNILGPRVGGNAR